MDQATLWIFRFDLFREDEGLVSYQDAEDLLKHITAWAEQRDMLVGGGFRAAVGDEALPGGPDFPASLLFPLLPEDD